MRILEHNQKDAPALREERWMFLFRRLRCVTAGLTNSVNLTKVGNLVYVASAGGAGSTSSM